MVVAEICDRLERYSKSGRIELCILLILLIPLLHSTYKFFSRINHRLVILRLLAVARHNQARSCAPLGYETEPFSTVLRVFAEGPDPRGPLEIL